MTQTRKLDTVYLYQFPCAKTVRNVSPFCLKIETFLRIHNIPYENVFILTARSKYGLVPYIELNGEQIADSQIIEERLKEHFKIPSLPDEKQEAIARFLGRMVDQHTFHVIYKYKLYDNPKEMADVILEGAHMHGVLKCLLKPILKCRLKAKAKSRIGTSLGMFSDDEFKTLLCKDLDAISHFLGDKPFLFGDKITSTDATIFGHLAAVYYLPYSTEVSIILDKQYPNLVQYLERIRHDLFKNDFTRVIFE